MRSGFFNSRTGSALACCIVMIAGVWSASAHAEKARTVLDYSDIADVAPSAVRLPESAFHAWDVAQREAETIRTAWEAQPVSLPWTQVQLDRYVKHKMSPSRGARGLALVHVAMHDAYRLAASTDVDARLAVSMAAAHVLAYLFPAEERAFERIAVAVAAGAYDAPRDALPEAALRGLALGQRVGDVVVARAQSDGAQYGWNGARLQWYGEGRYYGPGTWEPTPPYHYLPPDEPYAPGWKLWVLSSADQLRPTPPAFGSAAYLAALEEVIEVNRTLTDEQLRIAKFWVDGHGSVTPPGHWNQIAMEHTLRTDLDDAKTLTIFADLNMAMADTFIAVWDTKYHYWTIRPVTAAAKVLGKPEFRPAILTPPFPSYVSGHAGFSGTAGEVLGVYFPDHAQVLHDMAEEAAMSRLYGGIHYRFDNDDGLTIGRQIAREVLARRAVLDAESVDVTHPSDVQIDSGSGITPQLSPVDEAGMD